MDEVHAMRDGIHETMDEVIGLGRVMHATRDGINPMKLRAFASSDGKHAVDRRELLNHGFT